MGVKLITFRVNIQVVVNSVLLKCRKLRRKDQETSDSIVGFFIEKPQADGSCSHRNLFLSNFTRLFYRHFWRRDFLEVEPNSNKASTCWFCYQTSRNQISSTSSNA